MVEHFAGVRVCTVYLEELGANAWNKFGLAYSTKRISPTGSGSYDPSKATTRIPRAAGGIGELPNP
jgi:hypothetical protein